MRDRFPSLAPTVPDRETRYPDSSMMYLGGPKLTFADSPQVLPSSGLQPTMADRGLVDRPMSRKCSVSMSDPLAELGSPSQRYGSGVGRAAAIAYKAFPTFLTRPPEESRRGAQRRRARSRGVRARRGSARIVPDWSGGWARTIRAPEDTPRPTESKVLMVPRSAARNLSTTLSSMR